ncbi:hypothetical protein EDD21DRAFT_422513 [Dissophora ornata]|nr:hypothetical protein EDD21DRAFT_422513 [Dissophora ornata]
MDMPSQQEPVEKEVNFSEYIGPRCTAKEFKKKINREDLSVRKDEIPRYPQCFIRVLDTPGLDDTNGHDERNVAKILSSLSTAGDIHLVLIMISRYTAMLPGLQAALKTYSKFFSSMGSLIAFVHTQVDFQTHADAKLKTFLETRKRDLLSIMGRDIPQYIIDCDLEDDLPVHIYLRQRIIQSLLLLTRFNIPVSLKKMQLYKTKKMMEVDELIHKEQNRNLRDIQEKTKAVMKKMRDAASNAITDIDFRVTATRYKIRELEEYIRNNDTDDFELIHEDHFHENWELFSFRPEMVLNTPPLTYIIDTTGEDMTGIEIKEGQGGEDEATKAEKQQLEVDQSRCLDMIARASRPTLHLNLFKAIAEVGVYEGTSADCLDRVMKFYSTYIPAEGEEVPLEQDETPRREL